MGNGVTISQNNFFAIRHSFLKYSQAVTSIRGGSVGKKVSLMNKAWLDASRSISAQLSGEYELLPNLDLCGGDWRFCC